MQFQKALAAENIEVVYIIANANCMTLGIKFWGKMLNF